MLLIERTSPKGRIGLILRQVLTAGLLLSCAAQAQAQRITAAGINAELAQKGGAYVLQHYFECSGGPGYTIIASGTREGVQLAIRLLAYSDACFTEMIHSSLGEAMIQNPEAVLPYVNSAPLLQAEMICTPFLDEDTPKAELRSLINKIRRSLSRVHSGSLRTQKAACLNDLAQLRL